MSTASSLTQVSNEDSGNTSLVFAQEVLPVLSSIQPDEYKKVDTDNYKPDTYDVDPKMIETHAWSIFA